MQMPEKQTNRKKIMLRKVEICTEGIQTNQAEKDHTQETRETHTYTDQNRDRGEKEREQERKRESEIEIERARSRKEERDTNT